jgi:hypothetical protein
MARMRVHRSDHQIEDRKRGGLLLMARMRVHRSDHQIEDRTREGSF